MNKPAEFRLENILLQLLDKAPGAFCIVNSDKRVVYCDDGFALFFGVSKDQAIDQHLNHLLRQAWHTGNGVNIETDDIDIWLQERNSNDDREIKHFEAELIDGRWFKMTRVRLEDGYAVIMGMDITELKQTQQSLQDANRKIEQLANTDPLTTIGNRRAFDTLAQQEVYKAIRYRQPLSLLTLDIDWFKQVNDQYGHEAGDEVLKAFASLCRPMIRQSDIFCRIGGEEFVIMLPMAENTAAIAIAERLRTCVEQYMFGLSCCTSPIRITVSIGVSSLGSRKLSVQQLLSRADTALYQAKRQGRNRVCAEQDGANQEG